MLYQNVLDRIVDSCVRIFGPELTGIYLHGSMAMGCFHPEKSDIDLIVVIENAVTDNQKTEFMREAVEANKLAPDKGIELSIVKKAHCREFVYPTPFDLHFSNMHLKWFEENPLDYIDKMKGTDTDLAAHFMIIKKYGVVLYGAGIDDVFAEVPKENYIDSIWRDVEGAEEEILENPVYIILNLCRVEAFLKDNVIISKKQGGEWGLKNLPSEFRALISEALQCYELGKEMQAGQAEAERFGAHMLTNIKNRTIAMVE